MVRGEGGGAEGEGHSRDATCFSKTLSWHSVVQGQAKMSWGGGRGSGEGEGDNTARILCVWKQRKETRS